MYLLFKYKISLFIFPYTSKFFSQENSPGHNRYFDFFHIQCRNVKRTSSLHTVCVHYAIDIFIDGYQDILKVKSLSFRVSLEIFQFLPAILSVNIVFLITVSVSFSYVIQFCRLILLGLFTYWLVRLRSRFGRNTPKREKQNSLLWTLQIK